MMTPTTLVQISNQAGGDAVAYLTAPTEWACVFCGQANLQRFEVLNGCRCERCRLRYLEHADEMPECRCDLAPGYFGSHGFHHRLDYEDSDSAQRSWVQVVPGGTRPEVPEQCPSARGWLLRQAGKRREREKGKLLGER